MTTTTRMLLGVVLMATGLFSCRRPQLQIEVSAPPGYALDELTLELAVYAPGNIEQTNCASLAYDETTTAELSAALVLAQPLDTDGVIADFPVYGDKIVIVEARDEDGGLALRGCDDQLGELPFGPTPLALELAPAAQLTPGEVDLLGAEVGADLPPIRVTATDYTGDALRGATVRARLYGPGDATLGEVTGETDGDGRVELVVSLAAAGPFRLDLRAEVGRGAVPPTLPGLALPAGTAVDPFDRPGEDWLYVIPTRFGDGVAFVARSTAAFNPEVVIAEAHADGTFTDTGLDPGVTTLFLGSFIRPADDRTVLVFAGTRSALGVQLLADDGSSVTVAFPQRYDVGRVIPIGDCDDDDLGPALINLVQSDSAVLSTLRAPTHLALLRPEGGDAPIADIEDANFEPLYSTCRDIDGTTYRVLVARQAGRVVVRAVEGGIENANDLDDIVGDDNALPGVLTSGLVHGSDDGDLVTARLAGFSAVVELQTVVTRPNGFRFEPTPAFGLPALPSSLAAAPIMGGDPAEVVGLFTAAGGAERGVLMLGSREPGDAVWTVGAAPVAACDASTCATRVADADGDGTYELYIGLGYKLERNAPRQPVVAQVIRLD
jgi:hypothetical protein